MHETMDMADDPEYDEEEPSFSDSEDFVDDIEEDGKPRWKYAGLWPATGCANGANGASLAYGLVATEERRLASPIDSFLEAIHLTLYECEWLV